MHNYYFKIKRGDIEFEFSTSDKLTFEEQLSDWIKGTMNSESPITEQTIDENKPKRKGFVDVREMVRINEINKPKQVLTEENFDEILEETMENPKTEVIEKVEVITPFQTFLTAFNPNDPIDFLILTARFITENENAQNFSIKQLNAKLIPAGQKPIDHAVIDEALTENLIAVVPNYTEFVEVTEYTLTEAGEKYFVE